MYKRKIDCKNDNKKQTTFIQSNNADPKNALLIRLLLRRIHLPRWGRLREANMCPHNIIRCRINVHPKRVAEDVDPYGIVRYFYAETLIIPPREFHSRQSKLLKFAC